MLQDVNEIPPKLVTGSVHRYCMHKQTQKRRDSRQNFTADIRPNIISRAKIVLSRRRGFLNAHSKTFVTQCQASQAAHKLTFLPSTTAHAQTRAHHAQQTQGRCAYLLPTHGLCLLAEVAAGHHKAVLPDETVVGAGAPAAQKHRRPHPHALAEKFKPSYLMIRTPACAAQRSRKYIASI